MANYKEEEKQRARELYFSTSSTQAYIASQVGVAERTLSVWATEGNWKALKKAQFYSPKVEIQRLYEELRVISDNIAKRPADQRFPTKDELEARAKIIALIHSLDKVPGSWRNISGDLGLPEHDTALTPPTVPEVQQNSISA